MSKLYTEEQVTNLTESAFMAGQNHNPFIFQIELNKLTPIELPTDDVTPYTEQDIRFAYMQGFNRGRDNDPNHLEEYVTYLKNQKNE